jgi:ATP-dependent HslUV protease ATP-binding subunit HslU
MDYPVFDRSEFLSLQPEEITKELDKYIVGQIDAKKAVAVAMRNRWRRNQLNEELRKEIIPKNILMIGPTGCGKTEVARRMAKLADAPFIKVEATKFTEVGFKGQDVDQIIKDLLEIAIKLIRERETKRLEKLVESKVEDNILELLIGSADSNKNDIHDKGFQEDMRKCLRRGDMDNFDISYEPKLQNSKNKLFVTGQNLLKKQDPMQIQHLISNLISQNYSFQQKKKPQNYNLKEVRTMEQQAEIQKQLTDEVIIKRAITETEEYGIVFIDELDKITGSHYRFHADASDEGVQRDLLPLIEGTKILTDHGEVDTSKILFITAGAFHSAKPSDLLAELQGRLPIRVVLHDLSEDDMYRILTEPESHLIKQHRALLGTESVDLRFTDEAIKEIAKIASEVNQSIENIGARRLHTVLEKVLEEISFNASLYKGKTMVIDKDDVQMHMKELRKKSDLKQYIL